MQKQPPNSQLHFLVGSFKICSISFRRDIQIWIQKQMKLDFHNPFVADVAICPDILQLEPIELKANDL